MLFFLSLSYSQQLLRTTIPVVVNDDHECITEYYIQLSGEKDTLYLQNFKQLTPAIRKQYNKLVVSHIGYTSYVIESFQNLPDTLVLTASKEKLQEVVVSSYIKKENTGAINHLAQILMSKDTNSSFNDEWATYKEFRRGNLKGIEVYLNTKFEGVKNIDGGVFRISLYSVAADTFLPDHSFFISDTLQNHIQSGKFYLDLVNEKLSIPKSGLYVVFEVFDKEAYNPIFISSRLGVISATPMVKNKYSMNKHVITYFRNKGYSNSNWVLKHRKLKIKMIYED